VLLGSDRGNSDPVSNEEERIVDPSDASPSSYDAETHSEYTLQKKPGTNGRFYTGWVRFPACLDPTNTPLHTLLKRSQKVVQPIAGAGMQFGRETGWCLDFMKSAWGFYSQNTLFVWI